MVDTLVSGASIERCVSSTLIPDIFPNDFSIIIYLLVLFDVLSSSFMKITKYSYPFYQTYRYYMSNMTCFS